MESEHRKNTNDQNLEHSDILISGKEDECARLRMSI